MSSLRRLRAPLVALAALFALLPAAAAQAAKLPVVTKVKPLKVEVGQTMTIVGSGFVPGKNKNTVVFKRDGQPAVFAPASEATSQTIKLKVPPKLLTYMIGDDDKATVYRFRLRVLGKKFGKAFTSTKLSPQIGPPGAFGGNGDVTTAGDCDNDKIPNGKDDDDDNDGLTDAQEKTYKTQACNLDSDGDGVSDAFEIESALDLNSRALPFPGKRAYPNALDGSDAGIDFDQDGLTMADEYQLWLYSGKGNLPLTYSDGDQDTNPEQSDTPVAGDAILLDINRNGLLTDDEKDADADGLSNWDEAHGRMKIAWWAAAYTTEKQYVGGVGASVLGETSPVDPDSDGDGLVDGQDDQDHDGWTNYDEISRERDFGGGIRYWVHPYNPCLPDPDSRACSLHPPFGDQAWAPFPVIPPERPLQVVVTPVVAP